MQPIVRPKQCVRRASRAPAPPAPPRIMASEALALVSGARGGGSAPPPTSPVLTCETCLVGSDQRAWAKWPTSAPGHRNGPMERRAMICQCPRGCTRQLAWDEFAGFCDFCFGETDPQPACDCDESCPCRRFDPPDTDSDSSSWRQGVSRRRRFLRALAAEAFQGPGHAAQAQVRRDEEAAVSPQ